MSGMLGSLPSGQIGDIQHVIFGGEKTVFVFETDKDGWDVMRKGSMSTSVFVPRQCMLEFAQAVYSKSRELGRITTSRGTIFRQDGTLGTVIQTKRVLSFSIPAHEMAKFLLAIHPLLEES